MEPKNISKKDQIILQQLEVIRTMTENNLNRMGTDFWGTPPAESGGGKAPGGAGEGARPERQNPPYVNYLVPTD